MKKKSLINNDGIDLIFLFEIIWNGKFKILLITLISCLIGIGYFYLTPNNYLYSLTISVSDNYEFEKLESINQSNDFKLTNKKINQFVLNEFFNELEDYEEFLNYLRNKKKIMTNPSKLSRNILEKELLEYKKLLKIVKKSNIIINFEWDNIDEAKDILQNTINLTLNNLAKSVYHQLDSILRLQKKSALDKDLIRIEYLKEQSWIARELNISDNLITILTPDSDINPNYNAYYLIGYKAIDKEIELIEKRNYQQFETIMKEINFFKKKSINWINYNIDLINVKSLKNSRLIFLVSILSGLLIGLFYILISYELSRNTFSKKRD